MNLKTIEEPKKLLDIAFSKARKASGSYAKQKTKFYTMKGKEIAKIDVSGDYLETVLSQRVQDFPSINKLPLFYQDLFKLIIDQDQTKISLSNISNVAKLIKKMRRESIIKLKEMKFEQGVFTDAKKVSNEYFGRVSSLVKSLKKSIKEYNDSVKKLRELPTIKAEEEVFILAGFPNAGKSTLLSKITESKPKVAEYPFTTKGLNVGVFFKKYLPYQVIDTPGLLDRELHKRNNIEKKAISAFSHLNGTIIFVVDPTHDLKEQKNLFNELKKLFSDKGFIIVINKTDIASVEEVKAAEKEYEGNYIILEGEGLNNLKEDLLK
jgi:nucleolar GTP-binding protein